MENLYETIFKRKSVRKYDLTQLDEPTILRITEHMSQLKPMHDNSKVEMKLVSQNDVKGLLAIKAPHYIIVYSESKGSYLTNVGFMLQQMDLFLSSIGIGSCWLGMAKPVKEIVNNSDLEFVIVLAFGKPAEPLYRKSTLEFKRKALDEIRNISGVDELLEPVRLAPSASNSQPWFFTVKEEDIHAYCAKLNFLKAMLYEKMNKVDMGIAFCHLWIAAKHFGKDIEFTSNEEALENQPTGYYYIQTAKVK